RSDRGVEQRQPRGQILLDRKLLFQLGLQLQLARVVALLLAGGDERPEGALLEAVDPVHRVLVALEPERRREELPAEALRRQLGGDGIDGRDYVLEVPVADDHPLVPVVVLLPLDLGAGRRRRRPYELLHVALGTVELARGERLERDRRDARRLDPELGLE